MDKIYDQRRSYDKNGFVIEQRQSKAISYLIDQQFQEQRLKRWKLLLPKIPSLKISGKQGERKLINEVRQGIQDSLRYKVWPLLIEQPLKKFEECRHTIENKEINLDLDRTFPNHKEAKFLQQRMKIVLNSLAIAIPEVGYCQGMNFIVGTLLLRLTEEDAFKVAFHIFHWEKQENLLMDLSIIHQQFYALDRLIKKHYPKLYKQFKTMEIDPSIYASSWFITLYCNCLPACYAFRIIECFLLEGEKILYRVGLQILKVKKREIKALKNLQDVMQQLKDYGQFNEANVDIFFRQMYQISLSRDEIKQYRIIYRSNLKNNP